MIGARFLLIVVHRCNSTKGDRPCVKRELWGLSQCVLGNKLGRNPELIDAKSHSLCGLSEAQALRNELEHLLRRAANHRESRLPGNGFSASSSSIPYERSLSGKPAYLDMQGLARFQGATFVQNDVFLVSYPKCGTTWCHQILFCLLRMDEAGTFGSWELDELVGASGQVYPDGVPAFRSDSRTGEESQRPARGAVACSDVFPIYACAGDDRPAAAASHSRERQQHAVPPFGGWSIEDLMHQPAPRLFSSHIKAGSCVIPATLHPPGSTTACSFLRPCLVSCAGEM